MKVTLMICLLALFVDAQSSDSRISTQRPNGQPISSILNADGSIRHGISGSFDPKGFRMAAGPDGSPLFVSESDASTTRSPATDCNDGWDDRFWSNGPNSAASAVAADGAGNIYVGGYFTSIGNVQVNYIAKWDGTSWSPLGSGTNGAIRLVAVSGADVYAVGDFTAAGDTPANRVAKWNGSSWSPLGSGFDQDSVYAMAVSGIDVYVGGRFTSAGGTAANNVAKWNGSTWTALGSGIVPGVVNNPDYGYSYGAVSAIAVADADVYVGGWLTSAGGVPVNNIAKWNGTNWSGLGRGIQAGINCDEGQNCFYYGVNDIAVAGANVYVAGGFVSAGGAPYTDGIAKWNGSSWLALGTGRVWYQQGTFASYGNVNALVVSGADVYLVGRFTSVGRVPANNVAKWNGSSWAALGPGVTGVDRDGYVSVNAITVSGADVFVGGDFTSAGGVAADNIAEWNGSIWSGIAPSTGLGTSGQIYAIAVSGTDVYVGGSFTTIGGKVANGIAKWNGSGWSALGSGVSGNWPDSTYPYVSAIAVSGPDVYVGGQFTSAGGAPNTRGIAKWNGSSWSPLGLGVTGDPYYGNVYSIAASGPHVYVGGDFPSVGGILARGIAKWDGSSWSAVGSGIGGGGHVIKLAISGTDVYAGGQFEFAGGVVVNNIAKWNGASWSGLRSGTTGGNPVAVLAIAISGSHAYVGGSFLAAGCHAAGNFSRYTIHSKAFDFDADGRADIAVRRPSDNTWYIRQTTAGYTAITFGAAGDLIAPADFDGDGKTDIAAFRPSENKWYIAGSTAGFYEVAWGTVGDLPVPADYDGDGRADVAIYRPSTGTWYIVGSTAGFITTHFGTAEDKPYPADYDGDGKADLAVRRPSDNTWYILRTTAGFTGVTWGESQDLAAPADFDGDGKTDLAVFRPAAHTWFILGTQRGIYTQRWGQTGDVPVAADYDGDGRSDIAVWRPSDGKWYVIGSTAGIIITAFGESSDTPVEGVFDY